MENPLRQIVAFGGGGFSMESGNPLLDNYREGMRPGYAAGDGTALHFVGTELDRVVGSRPGSLGYRLDADGERVVEKTIATRYLGARR